MTDPPTPRRAPPPQPESQPADHAAAPPPTPRVWQSADLLGEACEVMIMHEGQAYRLRRTRQGKLILYK